MKNHKGQRKAFDRYVYSELNDDYLEAKLFQQAPLKQPNNKHPSQNDKNQTSKSVVNNPTAKFDTNLTSQLMKELALILGSEAKNCYFYLKEISQLRNFQVLQIFRDIYAKFETIPVLFLSFVQRQKEQIVYLWQINRKCPYQKGTEFMVLDSKSQKLDVIPHPSLLVLAKIKPFKGEEIIDTKLIGDYQLMVKSRSSCESPYYIFRFYNIKDFYGTWKVNPYREEILAGDIYSYELHVKRLPVENLLEVSLYKRLKIEEIDQAETSNCDRNTLIHQQSCEYSSQQQWPRDNLFSELITVDGHQMFYLVDKETCSIIKFHENNFSLETFPEIKKVSKILKSGQNLTFISNNKIYKLSDVHFQLSPTGAKLTTHPISLKNIDSQPQKFYDIFDFYNEPHAIMLDNTTFRCIPLNKPCGGSLGLFNIKDALKTSKSLSWSSHMMFRTVEYSHPLLFFICDNLLYIRDIPHVYERSKSYTREKTIALPSEILLQWTNNKQKDHEQSWDWEIAGFSSKKLYLSRKFVDQPQSVQLVEMNLYSAKGGDLFCATFQPEFKYIKKEDYYWLPTDVELFAQFDNRQEIVFISFENEPFYHDEVNLMYNVQLSLKNPQEMENQKGEKIEEEEESLYKKMEKSIMGISYKKDIRKGLEETKIKTEKKKMNKQRDKEKSLRKKGDSRQKY